MKNPQTQTVSISAQGTAQAKFGSVQYSASVNTTGRSGPEAKQAAKPVIDKIRAVIEKFAKEAEIDMARLKTNFSVTKATRYDQSVGRHVHEGYQSNYSISFTGKNVAMGTKVHDALTSIDGAEADSPNFLVDSTVALEREAFEDAVSKAKTRFAFQCRTLGENPDDYEVVTWQTGQDNGHRGKVLAMAASLSADAESPVDLEPGKAEQGVTVTLTFAKRATAPKKPRNGARKQAGDATRASADSQSA